MSFFYKLYYKAALRTFTKMFLSNTDCRTAVSNLDHLKSSIAQLPTPKSDFARAQKDALMNVEKTLQQYCWDHCNLYLTTTQQVKPGCSLVG